MDYKTTFVKRSRRHTVSHELQRIYYDLHPLPITYHVLYVSGVRIFPLEDEFNDFTLLLSVFIPIAVGADT